MDIRTEPSNDLSRQKYVPFETPWISASGAAWTPLANPDVGRVRYAPNGRVIYLSRGEHRFGYAVCLACGRAASETGIKGTAEGIMPTAIRGSEDQGHRRLRGGKGDGESSICEGSHRDYAVKRNLQLGGELQTDVFELELRALHDPSIEAAKAAASIAEAFRQAAAEILGIEARELGWETLATNRGGEFRRSIVIYDTADGGAGFVGGLVDVVPDGLRRAREILQCGRNCDAACHACLLSFETQHRVDELDRNAALEFLDDATIAALSVPEELLVLGADTTTELRPLSTAILTALRRDRSAELRIYIGGDAAKWDLADWAFWKHAVRHALDGADVRLVLPAEAAGALDWRAARALARMLIGAGVRYVGQLPGHARLDAGQLIAEVSGRQGSTTWATIDDVAVQPGPLWGIGDGGSPLLRRSDSAALPDLADLDADPETLERPVPGTLHEHLITRELDGPISQLGARVWAVLRSGDAALEAKLASGVALQRVSYSDRYVCSPLVARLLRETLVGLARSTSVDAATFAVDVTTCAPRPRAGAAYLDHDWSSGREQREVLAEVLDGVAATVDVHVVSPADLPHRRGLRLSWADGSSSAVYLDHGLGFLRHATSVRHDFHRSAPQQARAVLALQFQVRSTESRGAVIYSQAN